MEEGRKGEEGGGDEEGKVGSEERDRVRHRIMRSIGL